MREILPIVGTHVLGDGKLGDKELTESAPLAIISDIVDGKLACAGSGEERQF